MPRHPSKVLEQPTPIAEIEPHADSPFSRFSYSYAEMTLVGGKARVRTRHTRLEDGRLTTEAFEGDLSPTAYDQAVRRMQQHFLDQTSLFFRALSSFLPNRR